MADKIQHKRGLLADLPTLEDGQLGYAKDAKKLYIGNDGTNDEVGQGKQDTITGAATSVVSADLTASKALVSDSSGKIAASSTTATELGYVSGVTSALQTQIDGKQATLTGAATTITSSDLTASKALVSNASGKVAASSVTSTELGYVSGVTSAIQTQLGAKAPLASPALTGTPTAPLSTAYNDSSIASTTIGTVGHTLGLRREEILSLSSTEYLLTSLKSTLILTGNLTQNVTIRVPSLMTSGVDTTLMWDVINKANMGVYSITFAPPPGISGTTVSIASGWVGKVYANTSQVTPSYIINIGKIDTNPVNEVALPIAYSFPPPSSNLYDLTGLTSLNTASVRAVEVSYFLAATPTSAFEYGEVRLYWNGSGWMAASSNPASTSVVPVSSTVAPIVKTASHGTSTAIYSFALTNTSGTTWKLSINTGSYVYAAGHKLSYTYKIINQ